MEYGQGVEENKYFCTWVWETKSVVRDDKEIQAAVADRKRRGELHFLSFLWSCLGLSTIWLAFGANDSFCTSHLISVKPRDVTVVAAFVYISQSYGVHCARRVCSHIAPSVVVLRLVKHLLWEGCSVGYHIDWWVVLWWHKFLWQRRQCQGILVKLPVWIVLWPIYQFRLQLVDFPRQTSRWP